LIEVGNGEFAETGEKFSVVWWTSKALDWRGTSRGSRERMKSSCRSVVRPRDGEAEKESENEGESDSSKK